MQTVRILNASFTTVASSVAWPGRSGGMAGNRDIIAGHGRVGLETALSPFPARQGRGDFFVAGGGGDDVSGVEGGGKLCRWRRACQGKERARAVLPF